MTPATIAQLKKYDVTDATELKLEYFFYTNTIEKAKTLAGELDKLKDEFKFGPSASNKKLFIITGWTSVMKMSNDIVLN